MSELQPVNEIIEQEYCYLNVGKSYRQRLPNKALEPHDLYGTVVDLIVSQGEVSFSITDAVIDKQGRFQIPKKKAEIYGLKSSEPMNVYIDRVVLR